MLSRTLFIVLIIAFSAKADSPPPDPVRNLTVASASFIAVHHSDVRGSKELWEILRDVSRHDQIFSDANSTNWVELRSKAGGNVVFHAPSPSFDRLLILEADGLVVGLSNFKINNPYQLVVFDLSGDVIFRKHLATKEAIFSPRELEEFFDRHPSARFSLRNRVWHRDSKTSYVDFAVVGMRDAVGEAAWAEMFRRGVPNPIVKVIKESVTNYVRWFDSERTDVFVTRGEGGARSLVVPGLRGQAIKIPLRDQAPVPVGRAAPAA